MNTAHVLEQLVTTHCCACNLPLRDAESTERGMGPICSKKYYTIQHEVTPEMCQLALGKLLSVADMFEDEVLDAALDLGEEAQHKPQKARNFSNLLIKWASSNFRDRTKVLQIASIVRCLGYDALADKLEQDRTVFTITSGGDTFCAVVPNRTNRWFLPNIEKAGFKSEVNESGKKVTIHFKSDQRDLFMKFAGHYYGRKLAIDEEGNWFQIQFVALRDFLRALPSSQKNLPCMWTVERKGQWLHVRTPYNTQWITDLKRIPYRHRKWDRKARCWLVSTTYEARVVELCQKYFSYEDSKAA